MIEFFVETKPQPQGSSRAFVIGGKARITSANPKLKPYRQAVTLIANEAVKRHPAYVDGILTLYDKHIPLRLLLRFTFIKPPSARKRTQAVVKPDLDKLIRATCDALTGCVWHDDAQVVKIEAEKAYGELEGVLVTVLAA